MRHIKFILIIGGLLISQSNQAQILNRSLIDFYVEQFNRHDKELYIQYIPNDQSRDFLLDNIPLFECPNKTLEEIYYFRWWTFRKHLKLTPDGFIITEFLPEVSWAGKYNGICCPAWFHFREGRWLHNSVFLTDYANYWLRRGGSLRSYSFPVTDALYQYSLVAGNNNLLYKYFFELKENYFAWKETNYNTDTGLYWQIDGKDGMEVSIGGSGYRATINSYMYADAKVLYNIALENRDSLFFVFKEDAETLKSNTFLKLWDESAEFLKVLPKSQDAILKDVRELHGYTPWAFNMPDSQYAIAWKYLMDSKHFFAPYGLTTAEQCHPGFKIAYEGHHCQWNGPSWPFATSMTLTGLANLLNNQEQNYISKYDYYTLLSLYANSQYRRNEKGELIPWIDENLNPYTGDWIARSIILEKEPNQPQERGGYYNHSLFCDLIISGLAGIRPDESNELIINPLIPEGVWTYFCLDNVLYHGKIISVLYDKTGKKYNKGQGFTIFVNGKKQAHSSKLCKLKIEL